MNHCTPDPAQLVTRNSNPGPAGTPDDTAQWGPCLTCGRWVPTDMTYTCPAAVRAALAAVAW